MQPCKVLIVDDHAMFAESMALLLSTKEGIEVVGVAKSGEEALARLKTTTPNIVLMDIEMKDVDGIEVTRRVRRLYPDVEVIAVTMHAEEEYIVEALKAGAKGYVLKNFSSSFILEAIRAVQRGEHAFDPKSSAEAIKAATKIIGHDNTENRNQVTKQEVRILKLIADGCVNKEISKELDISIHTVRNHIANLFSKLNCSTRTKAVKEAQRQKLI
jgi:DNA-binding NarL/FixJ family response regulator